MNQNLKIAPLFIAYKHYSLVLHQPLIRLIDGDFLDRSFPNSKIIVEAAQVQSLKTVLLLQALDFLFIMHLAQRNKLP
jgi:hypothetical protein